MSEWIYSTCPKCKTKVGAPVWDDGKCPTCHLPFTFDPDRGKKMEVPSQFYWGVPGWKFYDFDTRPEPACYQGGKAKQEKLRKENEELRDSLELLVDAIKGSADATQALNIAVCLLKRLKK